VTQISDLNTVKVIALTHKAIELDQIGRFHIEDTDKESRLKALKNAVGLDELMYLSTCNRVEFLFTSEEGMSFEFLELFFKNFNPEWDQEQVEFAAKNCIQHEGEFAIKHLFEVASSLDSLVIGEREIITQLRKSYEDCQAMGLTGDCIRVAIQQTINAAKAVYTQSNIATKPVSVVSLAYHKLQATGINNDSRILVVGSGKTNTTMLKFLHKRGVTNYTIYNRTLENAKCLGDMVKGEIRALDTLQDHREPFDVLITCTGSSDAIITKEVYSKILNGDESNKIVVDLALPNDFDKALVDEFNIKLIAIEDLRLIADENLKARAKEICHCEEILADKFEEYKKAHRERQVELAMSTVPQTVKDIKERAYTEVFAKDLEELDENSKEVLDKVVAYLEKKYISVPMKMAREILLEKDA